MQGVKPDFAHFQGLNVDCRLTVPLSGICAWLTARSRAQGSAPAGNRGSVVLHDVINTSTVPGGLNAGRHNNTSSRR